MSQITQETTLPEEMPRMQAQKELGSASAKICTKPKTSGNTVTLKRSQGVKWHLFCVGQYVHLLGKMCG
jgi:hypothetical protein